MKSALILCFVALGTAACGPRSPVTTPGAGDAEYAVAIERSRNIVEPLVRRGSGVAVAVGVGGELVWSEGFGRTHRGEGDPVAPDMPFRVYSLMKPITAVLALQSAARREVDLTAPVSEVLPSLPSHHAGVTLQQLLTHTAGVRHYRTPEEAVMYVHCATAAEGLPRFVDDPLVAEPGVGESYSTYGFVLASAALEAAAGMPFDSLLATRILRPAGATDTYLDGAPGADTSLGFYDVDDQGRTAPAPAVDNSCKAGGGGFMASAEDLVRVYNAVLEGELVPLPLVERMLRGRSVLESGGAGPGGQAVSRVDFETGVSVVILSNTQGLEQSMALERARGLVAAMFEEG